MLELKHLGKTYHNKGGNKVKALNDINIKFDGNGLTFIFGPSGNGKSTLLNILGGIESYDEGEFFYEGVNFKTLTPKELDGYRSSQIGYIFQDYNLLNSLTVAENIKLAKSFTGNPPTDADVTEVLKRVSMEGFEKRSPEELSGGEKQRVSIARALVQCPKILFVDEPTGHLDQDNSQQVWKILKEISKTTLIIAVTHSKEIVDKYGDRVITLKFGEITEDKYKKEKGTKEAPKKKVKKEEQQKDKTMLNLQRGVMSFKHVFNMAKTNIGLKKIRSAFVIILSSFSLLFFTMFFILSNYNNEITQASSIIDNNVPYIGFVKSDQLQMTADDIFNIYDATDDVVAKRLIQVDYQIRFGTGFAASDHSLFSVRGLIETMAPNNNSKGNLNRLGQVILEGTYPTSSNYDAIAISDYVAALIQKYGYESGGTTKTISKISELIGKKIYLNNKQTTIEAIYETDYLKYVSPSTLKFNGYNEDEFNYNLKNIYSVIHVTPGHITTYIENASYVTTNFIMTKYDTATLAHTNRLVVENNYLISLSEALTTALPGAAPKYMFADASNISEALGNGNNIILPVRIFKDLWNDESFEFNEGSVLDLEAYDASPNIVLQINGSTAVNYNVVGVVSDCDAVIVNSKYFKGDVILSNRAVDNIYCMAKYPSNTLIVTTDKMSASELADMVLTVEGLGYTLSTFTSNRIAEFSSKIEVFNAAMLVASIFTAIFSLMLIFNFIAQTIEDRKHDIGIIRALGASNFDVAKIFMLSTAFVAAAIFICTTIITIFAVLISNAVIASGMALSFSIFALSPMVFVWLFLLSFGVSALGALYPILNFANKNPIDVIKRF